MTDNAIAENSSTASRVKVADIAINDDALGSETLMLTGIFPIPAGLKAHHYSVKALLRERDGLEFVRQVGSV